MKDVDVQLSKNVLWHWRRYVPIGKRPKIAAADLLLLGRLHLPPKALIKFPTPYMATRTTQMGASHGTTRTCKLCRFQSCFRKVIYLCLQVHVHEQLTRQQTKQHNTTQHNDTRDNNLFSKKKLPQVGLEPTTLCSLDECSST